jgi:DUF1009 family protein
MAELPKTLGIIAGSRSLPRLFVEQARKMGAERLVVAAFTNETDPTLEKHVAELEWMRVGQLDRMIKAFTSRGVTQCVMVGQIAPGNLFNLRPDLRAMKLLMRIKEKNAQTIFGGIADEMEKDGLKLITALHSCRTSGIASDRSPPRNNVRISGLDMELRRRSPDSRSVRPSS